MTEVATIAIAHEYVIGDRRECVADITGSTDYPADLNGYAVTPAQFGLSRIDHFSPGLSTVTAHTCGYDSTNGTVRVYVAGVEVADAVDIHTAVFRVKVTGKRI